MTSIYARVREIFRPRNTHDETANTILMRLITCDPEVPQEKPSDDELKKYNDLLKRVSDDFNWESIHRLASLQDVVDNGHEAQCKSLVCIPKKLLEGDVRFEANKELVTDTTGNTAFHVLLKIGIRVCRQNTNKAIELAEKLKSLEVDLYQPDSNGMTVKMYSEKFKEEWLSKWLNDEGVTDEVGGKEKFKSFCNLDRLFLQRSTVKEDLIEQIRQNAEDISPDDLIDSDSMENSSCNLFQMSVLKFSSVISDQLLQKQIGTDLSIRKFGSFHYYVVAKYTLKVPVSYLKYLRDQNIHPPNDVLFVFFKNIEQLNFNETNEHCYFFLEKINVSFQVITYYLFEYKENEIRDLLGDIISYQCPFTRDSVLHLAIKYSNESIVKSLIKLGVSLGAPFLESRNLQNEKPIYLLKWHIIEECLNNCITVKSRSSAINQNFEAEVNYSSWLPAETNNNSDQCESEFLAQFLTENNRKLSACLNHPVIRIFVLAKWYKSCFLFIFNIFYYLVIYCYTFFYCWHIHSRPSVSVSAMTNPYNMYLLSIYGIIVLLYSIRLFVRLAIYGAGFFKQIDGFIEIIILPLYLLELYRFKLFWSLNLLLLSMNFFFLLGHLPCLALKTVMYRKVSETFFKNITFYMVFIFSFVAYFMISVDSVHDTPNRSIESAFNNTYHTFLWFAGGDLKEEIHEKSALVRFITMVFILLIPVILQNLLLCLTLDDMAKIRKEAVHLENKERATYVHDLDQTLHFLHKHFFKSTPLQDLLYLSKRVLTPNPKILLKGTSKGNIEIALGDTSACMWTVFHRFLRLCGFNSRKLPHNVKEEIIRILEKNANSNRSLN